MQRILLVRLGALGDLVHALPAAAALRERYPAAGIDWIVDRRHRPFLDLVPILDRRIVWETAAGLGVSVAIIRELRSARYDAALDLQGLLKSAVLARLSGAQRVVGFAAGHLRERTAHPFYRESCDPTPAIHVVDKNLALAAHIGGSPHVRRFPIDIPASAVPDQVRSGLDVASEGRFAIINPGAAWPNKQWPPERFGEVARFLRERHGLPAAVMWGPGEERLARDIVATSGGAASLAPPTTLSDLVALVHAACLVVAGDTGPLHIAAAVGTPVVGIFGPTNPARNGPWSNDDLTVSRFDACRCHHQRRCHANTWCLDEIGVGELQDAVSRRLDRRSADA
jgi:lipopolysaccharide heptosyltransferase I